jgi:hypothetical protein
LWNNLRFEFLDFFYSQFVNYIAALHSRHFLSIGIDVKTKCCFAGGLAGGLAGGASEAIGGPLEVIDKFRGRQTQMVSIYH